MSSGFFNIPPISNEPTKTYAPGTPERAELKATLAQLQHQIIDVPMYIGDQQIFTEPKINFTGPNEHQKTLATYSYGTRLHAEQAAQAALNARASWASTPWEQRAAIFLKAADLISGPYRATINAATMLGQGKSVQQAEIDAACEFADFLRFNTQFMCEIYSQQPVSGPGVWNRVEYRPLEGFVFSISPFNFTAICGNLSAAPALLGNTVVWKPSETQIYSAYFIMKIFSEAGLPPGVINMVMGPPAEIGNALLAHPSLAGVHFTGSTATFKHIWKTIGQNIDTYKTYPRLVGETGGKNFILVHASAPTNEVVTAIIRGAFEYQGQKCSASSRLYIPQSRWPEIKKSLVAEINNLKVGPVWDFENFITPVIDKRSFEKIKGYINFARTDSETQILAGGECNDSVGYFIQPTLVQTTNPRNKMMLEEIFGPITTCYVYEDQEFENVLKLIDETSTYALTGAILSRERAPITLATQVLQNCAGNFYVNDKSTGAVVGQQPFGGARASGTNDKAGSSINLLRWVSARTIKETLIPATQYRYPYMDAE